TRPAGLGGAGRFDFPPLSEPEGTSPLRPRIRKLHARSGRRRALEEVASVYPHPRASARRGPETCSPASAIRGTQAGPALAIPLGDICRYERIAPAVGAFARRTSAVGADGG